MSKNLVKKLARRYVPYCGRIRRGYCLHTRIGLELGGGDLAYDSEMGLPEFFLQVPDH